jgi:hypothetical protein
MRARTVFLVAVAAAALGCDGGSPAAGDGGAVPHDGGALAGDGGAPRDGGTIPQGDGGTVLPSDGGGTPPSDAGSPQQDGGSPQQDGGGGPCPTLVEGLDTTAPPTLARPALNVPYTDPVYGLQVARVTDASQVTDRDIPAWVRHEYSRRPAFNADSTRALMLSSNGWFRLYEVRANGTLGFLKTIDVGEPDEPNWHPTDPGKLYTFEGYGQGFTITRYDVTTDQATVVANLGTRVKAFFPGATGMWTKQEGRPSRDGKIWCLEVGHTGGDSSFVADGLIAYDLSTDTILGHLAVAESPDHVSTSPSGAYCVPSWGQPLGTRAYTTSFGSYTQLHDRTEHSDLATTAAGDDVLVYTAYDGANAGDVVMVRLRDGVATPLFALYGANHSGTAMHISGTAMARPGYVVVSFYGCFESYGSADCDPTTQWFYNKVVAVQLSASPRIFNLAHTHFGDAGYFAETQAVANPDLTRVLFVSSWESTNGDDVASYMIEVPACALP